MAEPSAQPSTDPSIVLALDTATTVNVGLAVDGQVVGTATVEDRMAHVEQLLPRIRALYADSHVPPATTGRIVVGLGPGPFTGLRVGIVTAQTLAFVWGCDLHGVCTLDVLAGQHIRGVGPTAEDFLVATDARRSEVFWARYRPDGQRVEGPAVGRPDTLPPLPVVGPGADLVGSGGLSAGGPGRLDPGVMATLGPHLPAAGTQPLYLRRPDATKPGRRKRVLLSGARS